MSPLDTTCWKKSRYITPIEIDSTDKLLLFAGLFGRLIEVPGAYRPAAYQLLDSPNVIETTQHDTLHKIFREQGVIIPKTFDELDYFRQQHKQSKSVPSRMLGLTICPTLNCNFRCTYCYQHHSVEVMSEEIQNRIIQYVKEHHPPIEGLHVTWFGGEPLLGLPVIGRLTERFLELPIDYNSSIITNGSKLSTKVSKYLTALHVTSAQITLDGSREAHNARRPKVGNKHSFDEILANIAEADPNLVITVRINVDHRNEDDVPILFDQLDAAGLRERVSVYFAPVAPYTEVCADVITHCISGKDWAKLQSRLQLLALEKGYGVPGLPRARRNVCLADRASDIVIVPSGLVFKCWNDVTNPSQAIFDLSKMTRSGDMEKNLSQWLNWGPFSFSECDSCHVLPLCMGGCPHVSMRQGRGACGELKHNKKETIMLYYLDNKRKQSARQLMEVLHRSVPDNVIS